MHFGYWCCSMASRQVFEVPPTSVGGSLFSIGVCSRGADTQKVNNWAVLAFLH
jgi:vacuolar protein sorting-associated protein 13A/C